MPNVPIAAEAVFHIRSFPVTNAQINAWIALGLLAVSAFFIRFGLREVPGKFQNFAEIILEKMLGYFDQVTGDRERSKRFLPLAGTVFLFILISNLMGLFPGMGSIGRWLLVHGEMELVPIFRPANSDLNLTLAMALTSVIASHAMGVVALGFFTHAGKFFQIGGVWKAVRTGNPLAIFSSFVGFIAGMIEFVGELAKIASLSLRLFGNIFAGEVLITVIGSIFAVFVPLPFMLLEIIVGVVQATVFAMLTLVYLTLMTMPPHGEHAHESRSVNREACNV